MPSKFLCLAVWATITFALLLFSPASPAAASGPYTISEVSRIVATLPPGPLIPVEVHLDCLARSVVAGSTVTQTLVCYDNYGSAPPPPPPPYLPAEHINLVGSIGGSWVSLPVQGCTEVIPGTAASSLRLFIVLDKSGAGNGLTIIVNDTTAPFTCTEQEEWGPLTLTPLDDDHDEDGDGCTDWEELGEGMTAGGLRDPFNVYDLFDTPVGTAGQPGTTGRNGVINIGDVNRVIANFNRTDAGKTATPNRNDDILTTVLDPSKYHPAYDRGAPVGPNAWNLSPADGVINIGDVNRVIAQFNTVCA